MEIRSSEHVRLVVDAFDFAVVVQHERVEKLVGQLLFAPDLRRKIRDGQNAATILEQRVVRSLLSLLLLRRRPVLEILGEGDELVVLEIVAERRDDFRRLDFRFAVVRRD